MTVAAALAGGCSGDDSADPSPQAEDDPASAAAMADLVGCADARDLASDIFPLRGLAATDGVSCLLDGDVVHLFERAPAGDNNSNVYARHEGGSVENVRRTVGAGSGTPGCDVRLAIGERWFALAASVDTLDDVARALDGTVEPIEQATPTVSYLVDDCDLFR